MKSNRCHSLVTNLVGQVAPDLVQLVQEFSGGSCFWVREIIQCINDYGSEQFMQVVGESDSRAGKVKRRSCIASVLKPSSELILNIFFICK